MADGSLCRISSNFVKIKKNRASDFSAQPAYHGKKSRLRRRKDEATIPTKVGLTDSHQLLF